MILNENEYILLELKKSPEFRKKLMKESFVWFFIMYFSHYMTCPTADFQKEIMQLLEDENNSKVAITAFRGSAKSTIASLAYPIWAMIGKPQKKYILLISQTQELSKQILTNIKQELTDNTLLVQDFGPFTEVSDEWRANSIVNAQYGARISALSQSESVRGARHRQYRPDLIIVDDVEDLETVKSKETRNKLWGWLVGEVLPLGDTYTKVIFVGNLLHEDSLMMRVKDAMLSRKMDGIYREYPLIDFEYGILWPGKFPNKRAIELKKNQVSDDSAWHREYLLKILADEDRVVKKEWIEYYDNLPNSLEQPAWLICVGVDLAISESETADYTALVPAYVTGYGDNLKVYILPFIYNNRMGFPKTIETIHTLSLTLQDQFKRQPKILVENVGYQEAVSQQLKVKGVLSESIPIGRQDKRSRLATVSPYLQLGKIFFPKHGAEDLVDQVVNFGIEKHDDLVDAFTLLMNHVIQNDKPNSSGCMVMGGETIMGDIWNKVF